MESGAKRRNIPHWPPFKQSYQGLTSRDDLQLTPLPSTGRGPLSSQHTGSYFSPDLNSATAYTPDHLATTPTPTPYLSSIGKPAKNKRWFGGGWQASSKIALSCATLVLVANVAMTVAIVAGGHNMMEGVYMVYWGSCKSTETRDTWVHLALNLVATILLASSNYCMQLLSSPSRSEVDKAHAKRKWLDIGIPSVRNLSSLRKKKVILWWILGISSIPLHLVYNSVFYSALATNNYNVLYVNGDFASGAEYDSQKYPDDAELNITDIQSRASGFERITNEDCIGLYSKDFVEDRRNVLVVVKNPPADDGSLLKLALNEFPEKITTAYNAFAWICDNPDLANQTGACCPNEFDFIPCSKMTSKLGDMADQWKTGGFEVDYCLSERVESECHLHFSLILMAIVLGFNILKVIGIAYVAFRLGEAPLVTVGDAVESFIRHPDRTSEGLSLASHESVIASAKLGYSATAMRYDPLKRRFYEAATWKQWSFLLALFAIAGAGTSVCLALGIDSFKGDKTIANAWAVGLGQVKPQNLVMGWKLPGYGNTSIAFSTIIANTPQALFSFLYVCYNSLFTIMFLSRELMTFSVTTGRGRKYLRVSDPKGEQKCTYFLNLPYKYGIPLLVGSGMMHWLVSQSVFLANITIIPRDGLVPMQDEITTVAYSPLAMLFLLFLGFFLLIFLLGMAMRQLPLGMPLIGSNSFALSAACHIPGYTQAERDEAVLRPLSWGAIPPPSKTGALGIREVVNSRDSESEELSRGIGHCCFSDKVLDVPLRGTLYS